MGFFSARRERAAAGVRATQDAAIADFWRWWHAEGRDDAAAVFDGVGLGGASSTETTDDSAPDAGARDRAARDADLNRVGEAIGDHARALGLAFETSKGRTSRHLLVFSPEGDAEAADVAARWLAAAPSADAAFEYADRRQASQDPEGVAIRYGEHEFALTDMRVLTRQREGLVDVQVWHDAFPHAPREVVGNVTFLMLDALLGERVVEERVGVVVFDQELAPDAAPFLSLRELVV